MLRLRGAAALSRFRLDKLTERLQSNLPQITGLYAEYWHFVKTNRALSAEESSRLEQLLDYGEHSVLAGSAGLAVDPRRLPRTRPVSRA